MNHKKIFVLALTSLAACSPQTVTRYQTNTVTQGAAINGDVPNGALQLHYIKIPSLTDIEKMQQQDAESLSKIKMDQRIKALKGLALSYGARVGMAYEQQQTNQVLNQNAAHLSSIYDFQPFLIKAPSGQLILPPVISEMEKTWETSDNATTVRIADHKYRILRRAVFVQHAPIWQAYLYHSYKMPQMPQSNQLPKNNAERNVWKHYVDEGFAAGVKTARADFQESLRLLNRDYTGIARYSQLIVEGKVTTPTVSEVKLGVTGDGDTSSYNDRSVGIAVQPHLYAGTKSYRINNEVSPTPANHDMQSTPLPHQDTSNPPPPPSDYNPRELY